MMRKRIAPPVSWTSGLCTICLNTVTRSRFQIISARKAEVQAQGYYLTWCAPRPRHADYHLQHTDDQRANRDRSDGAWSSQNPKETNPQVLFLAAMFKVVIQRTTAPATAEKSPKKAPPKKRAAGKPKTPVASTSKIKAKEQESEDDEDHKSAAASDDEGPADEDGESELEEDAGAASKRCTQLSEYELSVR